VRARAPGKLVLSGAYSVLHGAPALVAAVDRFVVADSAWPASFVTDEVAEAVRRGLVAGPCGFDAKQLREPTADGGSRKLGLGSSAAILVASMALGLTDVMDDGSRLGARIFPDALDVHRKVQGGGSGVDVAASCFGGTLVCRAREQLLDVQPIALPGVTLEAWACTTSASTSDMLGKVRAFGASEPVRHRALMNRAREGAEAAVLATSGGGFIDAIDAQRSALLELGRCATAPIVTEEVAVLHELARAEGAVLYPAGAGGGDIALYVGERPSSDALRARASALGVVPLGLRFGAPGVELG